MPRTSSRTAAPPAALTAPEDCLPASIPRGPQALEREPKETPATRRYSFPPEISATRSRSRDTPCADTLSPPARPAASAAPRTRTRTSLLAAEIQAERRRGQGPRGR